jgi:protein O-GlcNAc transferase
MRYCYLLFASCLLWFCQGQPTARQIEQLRKEAQQHAAGPESLQIWQKVLDLDPKHLEAHVMIGSTLLGHPLPEIQEKGILMLEDCHNASRVKPTLDMRFPEAIAITSIVGRYRSQHNEYEKAKRFTEIAYQASKAQSETTEGDLCLEMQLASLFDFFPKTEQQADLVIKDMNDRIDAFLRRSDLVLNEDKLSDAVGPAAPDPYVHCLLSLFQLSFYYRADVAAVASKHYQMAAVVWPDLLWTAPHVMEHDQLPSRRPCEDRRIRLGIVSGVITEGHSVSEDFSGVLTQLNRITFDVIYIYVKERATEPIANFTKQTPWDTVLTLEKGPHDVRRGAWVRRLGEEIANLRLDMILYLDLTMSTHVKRLGMMRLAPVQLNTHGHPITSGHPPHTIQYFVSWAEAELPSLKEAQTHYTEHLKLIPKGKIHQYYMRRILDSQVSRMDGMPFGHLGRRDFGFPEGVSLYTNMNKPQKIHPEFDRLVCGIMMKDPHGHVALHKADREVNQEIYEERLVRAGCDMARVHFLPTQPHHRLMGLVQASTVVLDSYPAGGCTTTREILEVGKAVVTLPARLLGGRWTLGYYNIIDLDESAKEALIAKSEDEYINLAVALGTRRDLRESVEASIREAIPRLFGRYEAVREWENILRDVSPVQQCQHHTSSDEF